MTGSYPLVNDALASRMVSTIATDHAPFDFKVQKEMGRDDFTKIPNGIPSVEDRVNLVYTCGVKRGRIDLHTFVDACSFASPSSMLRAQSMAARTTPRFKS